METITSRKKHFTQEKRQSILSEHKNQGIPIAVLARKYGLHAMTMYTWKRQMTRKKEEPIDQAFIQKLLEENDRLKAENKNLLAKVGDLAIKNDILKDGLEIVQKKALLKALQPPKKSKRIIGMR